MGVISPSRAKLDRNPSGRVSRRLCALAVLSIALIDAPANTLAFHPQPSVETLLTEGEAAINAGDPKLALRRFQEALPLAEGAGDALALARCLAGLGWAQWAGGEYEASLKSRRRALDILTTRGDIRRRTAVLKGIGEVLYSMGRFDEALAQYREALENEKQSPIPLQRGLIMSNMGSAYRSLGRFDEAAATLEEALAVLRGTEERGAVGQALIFLGIVNRARGEYDKALSCYRDALAAMREAGDRRAQAQILGNTANVYLDLGQLEQAIALNRQSLALAEEVGYTVQIGFANHNIGAALSRIPRPAEALKHYRAALDIYRKIGRNAQVVWTTLSVGTLQAFLLEDRAAGRATLQDARALAEKSQDREALAHVRYELGSLDLHDGRYDAAHEHLTAALTTSRELGAPDLEYQVLANRGRLARKMGRAEEALADLRASAKIVNDLRANVASDQAKIAYIDTRQSVFHDLVLVLTDMGRTEEALEAAEAGRARALADLLDQQRALGRPAQRQALKDIRAARRSAPAPASSSGTRGTDPIAVAIDQLERRDPEFASLLTVASPRITEIKQIARRLDATILEYLVTERTLYAWVVDPDGTLRHSTQSILASHLAQRAEELRRSLHSVSAADLRRPDALRAELRALYDLLIEPVAAWLPSPGSDRPLVIVPHGATALVPFAALTAPDGAPLIDRQRLSFAPSIATFRYTAAKRRATAWKDLDALVVADPAPPTDAGVQRLPGTLDEARSVAARFGRRAEVMTGREATEAAVTSAMRSRRVIHLATHGLISSVRPIASSLLLAEGNGEDGYLRLDEIFGLELAAELVVLSGCSTGVGRLTGDGIFGLTRGFIYAGTPSVVVSNWDVSDHATVYLMDRFYASLSRGATKAAALAQAQRDTRRRYPHPALWAAFVLVGEPR
jgi:CHAT domain-containing protein/Tfp pilus assembly protein PilF